MTLRLQASSVSKSGRHPTRPSIAVDGHSQPRHGHTTTTAQIPYSYPQIHTLRSTFAPANATLPGSPSYRRTTRTMTNPLNMSIITSTTTTTLIMMMASDSQSMKRGGRAQCRVFGKDQKATRYDRSTASSCWRNISRAVRRRLGIIVGMCLSRRAGLRARAGVVGKREKLGRTGRGRESTASRMTMRRNRSRCEWRSGGRERRFHEILGNIMTPWFFPALDLMFSLSPLNVRLHLP